MRQNEYLHLHLKCFYTYLKFYFKMNVDPTKKFRMWSEQSNNWRVKFLWWQNNYFPVIVKRLIALIIGINKLGH